MVKRVVCLVLAVILGTAIMYFVIDTTARAMNYNVVRGFSIGDSIINAWKDSTEWIGKLLPKQRTNDSVLVFGPTNLNIEVRGLGV